MGEFDDCIKEMSNAWSNSIVGTAYGSENIVLDDIGQVLQKVPSVQVPWEDHLLSIDDRDAITQWLLEKGFVYQQTNL